MSYYKDMTFRARTLLFVVSLTISILIACAVAYFFVFAPTPEERAYTRAAEEITTYTDADYHRFFVEHIDVFYRVEGINGMITRVGKALTETQINMFVCHSLAHDIGHYGGYSEHFKDIEASISKENLDFCGSGFQHGVEGELANMAYPQNVENLYYFCKLVLPYKPYYGGCYHGAGHSFMENTRNVKDALTQCDLLILDEDIEVGHCYRGVFSENANVMHKSGAEGVQILASCNELSKELQYQCAMEVNGLEIPHTATGPEVTQALRTCIENAYSFDVKRGCVRSVGWVATDHIIGQGQAVLPPAYLKTLSETFMREYIDAVFGTFKKNEPHVLGYTLEPFCMAFEGDVAAFCRTYLNKE